MLINHDIGSIESLLRVDTTTAPPRGGEAVFSVVGDALSLPTGTGTVTHTNGLIRFNTTTQRIEFSNAVDAWLSTVTIGDVTTTINQSYLTNLLDSVYVNTTEEFNTLVDARITTAYLTPKLDATYVNVTGDTISGNLAFTSNARITGLANPVDAQDAATKAYVDSVAAGLDPKESVRVATTANIDLTAGGLLTVDGVQLVAGNRVLVRAQTDATQNGIYVAAEGAWVRATDQDGTPANEVSGGNFTYVEQGSTYSTTGWVLQGNGNLTLGTDSLVWVQFSAAGTVQAGAGLSQSGTTLSIENGGVLTTLHGGTGLSAVGTAGTVLSAKSDGTLEYKTVSASAAAGKLGATVDIIDGSIVIGTTAVLSVAASTTTTGLTVTATETAQDVAIVVDLNAELQAVSQLSTTGLVARTGAATYTPVTITGTSGNIVITDGNGVAGAPTIDLAPITQASSGDFKKVTLDGFGRVTGNTAVTAADISGLAAYTASTGISLGTAVAGVVPISNTGVINLALSTTSTSARGINGTGFRTDGTTAWSSGIMLGTASASLTEGTNTAASITTKDGTFYLQLNSALESLANLDGSGMISVNTAAGAYVERSIEGTSGNIVVTNGNGIQGNPTINLAAVTQGTTTGDFKKFTVDGFGRVTNNTAVLSSDVGGLLAAGTGIAITAASATVALDTLTDDTTGTFLKFTRDAYGRVQGTTAVGTSDITALVSATYVDVIGDTMTGDLTFTGGKEVKGLPAIPTGDDSAASKLYVDTVAQGLDPKGSVRAATSAAGDLAVDFAAGATVGGVTVAAGDRIMIRNQVAKAENGIYVVAASGAPTRSLDANAWNELVSAFVFVEEGTYADTGWVCKANQGGTLGTTDVEWIQFTSAGNYSATTSTGLSLDGTVFSITTVPVANGGTGLTAAGTAGQVLAVSATPGTLAYRTIDAGAGVAIDTTTDVTKISIANTGVLTINSSATDVTGLTLTSTFATGTVSQEISGVVNVTHGGTGLSTAPSADGQLLIGSTAGAYALATLSTGNGIAVTNGAGTISIANTGVLSVGSSTGTTGLSMATTFNSGTGAVSQALSGTLNIANGGTGTTSAPAAGQLLIGTSLGAYNVANLIAGPGISIANADAGTITISGSGQTTLGTTAEAVFTIDTSTPGTAQFNLDPEAPNKVFAGPASGSTSEDPTFRSLVYADLPIVNYTETATSQSTITATAVDVVSDKVVVGAAADAKTAIYTAKVSTTDATAGTLAIASQTVASLWTYTITIAAIGSTNQAAYKLEGGVMYNGTTSTILGGSKSILAETSGAQTWDVAVATSGGALTVSVTGAAATSVKWVASAVITQVNA